MNKLLTKQEERPILHLQCGKGHEIKTQHPDAFTYTVWVNDSELVSSGPTCAVCMVEFYKKNFGMTEIE